MAPMRPVSETPSFPDPSRQRWRWAVLYLDDLELIQNELGPGSRFGVSKAWTTGDVRSLTGRSGRDLRYLDIQDADGNPVVKLNWNQVSVSGTAAQRIMIEHLINTRSRSWMLGVSTHGRYALGCAFAWYVGWGFWGSRFGHSKSPTGPQWGATELSILIRAMLVGLMLVMAWFWVRDASDGGVRIAPEWRENARRSAQTALTLVSSGILGALIGAFATAIALHLWR